MLLSRRIHRAGRELRSPRVPTPPMHSPLVWLASLACMVLGVGCTVVAAQDPPVQGPVAPPNVREAPLGPVILQENGEGVVLPGVTVESYRRLVRQLQNEAAAPPVYSIERVELTGIAPKPEDPSAILQLQVKFQIRLTAGGSPARVPIGMPQLVLRSPAGSPGYDGPGSARIEYSERQRQFICVLTGDADSFHEVSFKMACAIQPDRLGQRIAFSLPNAPTIVRITVPTSPIEGNVSKGNYLLAQSVQGERTNFTLEGQGEELQFTWRRGARPIVNTRPSLTAQATISVHIQDQLNVRAVCTLVVTSVGAPLRSFDVRLPPGMKLTTGAKQPGLNIRSLNADELPADGETVRITLDEPEDTAARVELTAQGGGTEEFETLGFEVLDAFQRGTILVTTDEGWTAQPIAPQGVNRISPPADAPLGTWQYAFENRARSLKVKVAPAKSRLHIEPTYATHVVRGQQSLRAEFRCTLGGADVGGSLGLHLPGWTIRNISSDRLADLNAVDLSVTDPLQIPLTRGNDEDREFTITIEAARPLTDDADRLEFSFPKIAPPVNTTITTSSAQLAITSADDIELAPDVEAIQGLTPSLDIGSVLSLPPELQQAPLIYNDLVGEDVPAFAASMTYHAQAISADISSVLTISDSQVAIQQRITHRIAYVPVRRLLLDAPSMVLEPNSRLAISLGSEPLNAAPVDEPSESGRATLRVELPERTIGDCELMVNYRLPDLDVSGGELTAPLILPVAPDGVSTHRLELKVDESLQREAELDGAWQPDSAAADTNHYLAQASGAQASIQLRDQQPDTSSDGALVLKTWVQTWLQNNVRRDRVAFRLRTDSDSAAVQLPAVPMEHLALLYAAVDGRRTLHQFDPSLNRVTVPIPRDNEEHVLELWYSLPPQDTETWLDSPQLTAPRFVNAVELGQSFWQIFVPDELQLVSLPPNITADLEWRWDGAFWQQLSSHDSASLEAWVGASSQERLPSGLKDYGFTTSGPLPQISIQLVRLQRLVLLLAFTMMLIIWACLYWPVLRSPAALSLWGFVLLVMATMYPGMAFGIAQALVLAFGLIAVGQLLRQSLLPAVNVATESVSEAITRTTPAEASTPGTTASAFPLSADAKS